MSVLDILRLFFGSVFILFLPGFVWSYVFFARKHIDWIERVALSFGLSIALVPLTIFWLNWLFDMSITLVNTSLAVCGLIAIAGIYIFISRSTWGKKTMNGLKTTFRRSRKGETGKPSLN
jgi:uncharacterized membrane protein